MLGVYFYGNGLVVLDLRSAFLAVAPIVDIPCVLIVSYEFLVVLSSVYASNGCGSDTVHEGTVITCSYLPDSVFVDLVFLNLMLTNEEIPTSSAILFVAVANAVKLDVVRVHLISYKLLATALHSLLLLLLFLSPAVQLSQLRKNAIKYFIFLCQHALQVPHFFPQYPDGLSLYLCFLRQFLILLLESLYAFLQIFKSAFNDELMVEFSLDCGYLKLDIFDDSPHGHPHDEHHAAVLEDGEFAVGCLQELEQVLGSFEEKTEIFIIAYLLGGHLCFIGLHGLFGVNLQVDGLLFEFEVQLPVIFLALEFQHFVNHHYLLIILKNIICALFSASICISKVPASGSKSPAFASIEYSMISSNRISVALSELDIFFIGLSWIG